MLRHVLTLLVVSHCLLAAPLRAQSTTPAATPLPALATEGLRALAEQGPDVAIRTWLRGAAREGDSTVVQPLRSALEQFAAQAGRVHGHDVVHIAALGPHVRRAYIVVRYTRGPLFMMLDMYESPTGWIMQNLTWNSDATQVFPAELLTR